MISCTNPFTYIVINYEVFCPSYYDDQYPIEIMRFGFNGHVTGRLHLSVSRSQRRKKRPSPSVSLSFRGLQESKRRGEFSVVILSERLRIQGGSSAGRPWLQVQGSRDG